MVWVDVFCSDTFYTNPQYLINVIDSDEGDDDNTGNLIVALMQSDPRQHRSEGRKGYRLGYSIYEYQVRTLHKY